MAALQHFRRPDVSIDGENVTIYSLAEREPVPLSLMHHPVCITFSFYHGGELVLLDATLQEEQARESEMIITMNKHGELCQIAKLGGIPVDALALLGCTNMALVKVKEISELISTKLSEDATRRDVGGLIAELSAQNDR
jgi:exosome complex component RRP45